MGGNNGKLQDLTNRLIDKTRAYGMEVSTEMSKIKTNSMNNISADKVTVKSENIKIAALSILLVIQHSQVLEASQKAKFYWKRGTIPNISVYVSNFVQVKL